jgi:LemA protein
MQRRFDLIPNLVSAVEGAMAQERTIFTALAEARSNMPAQLQATTKLQPHRKSSLLSAVYSSLLRTTPRSPARKTCVTYKFNLKVQRTEWRNRDVNTTNSLQNSTGLFAHSHVRSISGIFGFENVLCT